LASTGDGGGSILGAEDGTMDAGRRCFGGDRLMFAGAIVMLVGLAVVAMRTLALPGYWTPVVVGAVLFLIGGVRRAIGSRDELPPRERRDTDRS
jgi:hypothetical protein